MTKILYIAGYGRSGSTVLNIILDNHQEITGIGEAHLLVTDWASPNHFCSCGAPYTQCEFWKGLFLDRPPTSELAQLVQKIERLSFIPRLLLGLVAEKDRQIYRTYQEGLFSHVATRSGSLIVADSSKSARNAVGRLVALTRLADQDVYVLHLVRNGLATMESLVVTGSNRAIEGHIAPPKWRGLRAAIGWTAVNAWTSLMGRFLGPERYMLLRYEDLLADPTAALRIICQLCGLRAEELIERIGRNDYFRVKHLVRGNRIRSQRKVRLQRENRQHPGDRLALRYRLLFAIVGGWLDRFYGYRQ